MCSNLCVGAEQWASDGSCDDGGQGSDYGDCEHGSDCADCGMRCDSDEVASPASPAPPTSPVPEGCVCSNLCVGAEQWASDGSCDDGGQGSDYGDCEHGSDCADCGMRCASDEVYLSPRSSLPPTLPLTLLSPPASPSPATSFQQPSTKPIQNATSQDGKAASSIASLPQLSATNVTELQDDDMASNGIVPIAISAVGLLLLAGLLGAACVCKSRGKSSNRRRFDVFDGNQMNTTSTTNRTF